MNHNEYKEQLSAFLDGELTDAERDGVLAHLETCEACRTYLAELTALHDAFGDLEDIDAPEGFAEGVLARLHEEAAPQQAKKRNPWRGIATLAACAAVVVLAISAMPRMGGSSGSSGSTGSAANGSGLNGAESFMITASSAPAAAEPEAPAELLMNTANDAYGEAAVEENEYAAKDSALTTETAAADLRSGADEAPVLTLSGEGAAEWLKENAEPLGDGRWLVTVEAVNALPDTLELVAADEVQKPVDGMLIVTPAETEAAP